jgi:glycerol-3-phosphate dehydrogenase subunit C
MRPEKPPAFDPNEARYWDPRDLEGELERVFSICHGCRMCVGYCPSFPELFERVDRYVAREKGEVDAFVDRDYVAVNDLCYQCKICYFKCPYTPDDGHDFMVDFPRLMQRHKAQRAARDGVTIQDQALGEPQLLGQLASGLASIPANFVSASRLARKAQELVTGISAEFNLPPFARQSLRSWYDRHRASDKAGEKGEVVLFATCTVDWNLPSAGRAAIEVLERNGYAVAFPKEQTCCGMPNLDGGDVAAAKAKAEINVAALAPHVRAGRKIVVPGPTCSYVLRKEYPELLGGEDAALVSKSTMDLMEFLRELMRAEELDLGFTTPLGKVATHVPCHLRAQKIGFPAWQVLKKIPDTEVVRVEQCSAVDGTWGMKAQHYEMGRKYAQKLKRGIEDVEAKVVVTDCPLSAKRIEQENDVVPLHPMEALAGAYGLSLEVR